jgi:hypothetical protein
MNRVGFVRIASIYRLTPGPPYPHHISFLVTGSSNGHIGLFKTKLTLAIRSEVILLDVKLKVAIFSIYN